MNDLIVPEKLLLSLDPKQLDQIIRDASLADLVGDVRAPGYPDRLGNYQYTFTGKLFWACDPRPEEVDISDIAIPLSRIPRFNGNTKKFMSVAEHCWIGSYHGPEETALERLLHDAPEAYIGDEIRPLKMLPIFGAFYLKIEDGIMRAIVERFDLQYPFPPCVRQADEALLGAEIAQNIASKADGYLFDDRTASQSALGKTLYFWEPALAAQMFLSRFHELKALRHGKG